MGGVDTPTTARKCRNSQPMREKSVYEIVCECAAKIETHEPETTCRKCGRQYRIEWQGAPAAAAAKGGDAL